MQVASLCLPSKINPLEKSSCLYSTLCQIVSLWQDSQLSGSFSNFFNSFNFLVVNLFFTFSGEAKTCLCGSKWHDLQSFFLLISVLKVWQVAQATFSCWIPKSNPVFLWSNFTLGLNSFHDLVVWHSSQFSSFIFLPFLYNVEKIILLKLALKKSKDYTLTRLTSANEFIITNYSPMSRKVSVY